MKLARKLTLALVGGILVVMAIHALFQLRHEIMLSEADMLRGRRIGLAWIATIEDVWKHEGAARAFALAARASAAVEEGTIKLHRFPLTPSDSSPRLSAEQQTTLSSGEAVRTVEHDPSGKAFAHIYVPLRIGGDIPAIVEYIEAKDKEQSFIATSRWTMALATLGVVFVCGLIATGLQYLLVGRPLQLMRDKARRAGAGDFSAPLTVRQKDEMGELAQEINGMCERIAAANRQLAAETEARITAIEQLRHTDRLATVGQLAAGVAHELGTPLNVVSARAELIGAAKTTDGDQAQHARAISEQCDRMTAIVQQLLDFSRRRGIAPGLTDLRHVVLRTVDLLSMAAEKGRVRLQVTAADSPLLAHVDQNQIQQALINIILNGIQSMRDGGNLRVALGTQRGHPPDTDSSADADYACVTIADEGSGIAREHLDRLFEPFFTTKRVGEGTGLGLAVAHGIVAEHGGWIAVDSTVGRGTVFSVFLPVTSGATATQAGAA
jgi:two-component system NtrC family sensor kinase